MREYDEITLKIAERIFEKGDEIIEERRKRSAMIKKLSLSVSGLCAAVIAGFVVWNNENLKNASLMVLRRLLASVLLLRKWTAATSRHLRGCSRNIQR